MDRGVATGVSVGVLAPPEFGRSINSIQTWGRLCPSHYVLPAPRILKAIYTSVTAVVSIESNLKNNYSDK